MLKGRGWSCLHLLYKFAFISQLLYTCIQLHSLMQVLMSVLCSYAVLLIEKKDEEGQSHVLSAALEVCLNYSPTLELNSIYS